MKQVITRYAFIGAFTGFFGPILQGIFPQPLVLVGMMVVTFVTAMAVSRPFGRWAKKGNRRELGVGLITAGVVFVLSFVTVFVIVTVARASKVPGLPF